MTTCAVRGPQRLSTSIWPARTVRRRGAGSATYGCGCARVTSRSPASTLGPERSITRRRRPAHKRAPRFIECGTRSWMTQATKTTRICGIAPGRSGWTSTASSETGAQVGSRHGSRAISPPAFAPGSAQRLPHSWPVRWSSPSGSRPNSRHLPTEWAEARAPKAAAAAAPHVGAGGDLAHHVRLCDGRQGDDPALSVDVQCDGVRARRSRICTILDDLKIHETQGRGPSGPGKESR